MYIPTSRPNEPVKLRTCSSVRARLFAGGTYFRAKNPGTGGNNISVQVIQEDGLTYCVVMNKTLNFKENVLGINPKMLSLCNVQSTDIWIIDRLDSSPLTHFYSTSLRIRNLIQASGNYDSLNVDFANETKPFNFEKMFSSQGKISLLAQKNTDNLTSEQRIIITPRIRIYQIPNISKETMADPTTGLPGPVSIGLDIENLRAQINNSDPWIEMLSRSGDIPGLSGSPNTPNPNPSDIQDPGLDSDFLTPFNSTNLSGGDGLPPDPSAERTGPSKSLILVSNGELQNGSQGEINSIFEWVGDSAISGDWIKV